MYEYLRRDRITNVDIIDKASDFRGGQNKEGKNIV